MMEANLEIREEMRMISLFLIRQNEVFQDRERKSFDMADTELGESYKRATIELENSLNN